MPEGRPVTKEVVSFEFRGVRRGVRAQCLLSSFNLKSAVE